MTLKDQRLTCLADAALAARQRYNAAGLAGSLKNVTPVERATSNKLAELEAAEAALKAADKALADYKATTLTVWRDARRR